MNTFYRYIRPVYFNPQRGELATHKKGGVCLRFEEQDGELRFSYAACDADQTFSKDVAKIVADRRADVFKLENKDHTVPMTKSSEKLCQSVIEFCLKFSRKYDEDDTMQTYQQHAYGALGNLLHTIVTANKSQEQLMKHYKDAVAASSPITLYAKERE